MLGSSVLENRCLAAVQGNPMNLNNGTQMIFSSHKRSRHDLAPTGCLLLVALWVSPCWAQTSPLTPFEKTLRYALSSNPKIQAAKFTLEATQERYHQTLASLLPEITLNASQSRLYSSLDRTAQGGAAASSVETPSDSLNPNSDLNRSSREVLSRVGLSATQPLLRWPLVLALQQTSSIIAAAEEDLGAIKNNVLLETIQAIISLLLAENMEQLAKNNLTFTQRNLAAAEARRKAGYITQTDVNQATARVASAKAELIRAKNEAKISHALFEEVTGLPVPDGLSIPQASSHLLGGTLQALSALIVNRPDIKASKSRLESADYSVRMEKAGHLPIINLTADATAYQSDTDISSIQGNQYNVIIQLSLPIFSGGRTVSKTRESLRLKASAQAEFDRIQNQAKREVNQSYLAMYSAQASVSASEAAFKFYRETLKGIDEEFNAGFRTVIDLLEAQNQLFRSETDLVKNQFELITSQYQLLHTIGRLTLENLQIPEIENHRSPKISTIVAEKVPHPSSSEVSNITHLATPKIGPKKREPQSVPGKWGLRFTRWLSAFNPQPLQTTPMKWDGPYFVSAGSFTQAESIATMMAKLSAAGHHPMQEKIQIQGIPHTRLLFGPFKIRKDALKAQKNLARKGNFKNSIVIHSTSPLEDPELSLILPLKLSVTVQSFNIKFFGHPLKAGQIDK